MWRRRSPSVMTPTSRPSSSQTPTQPKLLAVITRIASDIGVPGETSGTASPACMISATRSSVAAEPAAGMEELKIGCRKAPALEQRNRQRVAQAPASSWSRWSGPAPSGRPRPTGGSSSTTSAASARVELRTAGDRDQRDVEAPRIGEDVGKLGVSPEFDSARIASSAPIMPRSPWLASPGWTNCAGVPVEAKVAAILRAMWPLLPMPVTMIRPFAAAHEIERRRKSAVERRRERFEPVDFGPHAPAARRQDPAPVLPVGSCHRR